MRTRSACKISVSALVIASATAAWADIDYQVSILPDQDRVEVAISLPENGAKSITLQMPNWMPGLYILWPSGNSVHDFRASDSGGTLTVDHPESNSWTVTDSGSGTLTVSYWVPSRGGFNGMGAPGSADAGFVELSGPTTYLYVSGRKDEACRLKVEAPSGWPVMTGLDSARNSKTEFSAPNYDVLADNPIASGDLIIDSYVVRGKSHFIVLAGTGKNQVDRAALLKECRFVSASETDFWGGAPYHKYVWLFNVHTGRGFEAGLEHLSSTQISLAATIDARTLGLLAHEYFHLWNVKRIRPIDLGPFDYTKLPRTGALWWLEGVTDYYANLLPYRYGGWDRDRFFHSIQENFDQVERNPARLTVSPYEASVRVGEASGGKGNSNGYEISYYNLGWLCGLCLDIEIRSQSNGKHSLDDVAHSLYDLCKDGKPGFQEGEIRRQCIRFGGPSLGPFYDQIVMKAGELPVADELAKAGFKLEGSEVVEDPSASPEAKALGGVWLERKASLW